MTAAVMPPAERWAPVGLAIAPAPKPPSAPISARFSRRNAGDLDALAQALYATLAGSEIVVECDSPDEAKRVRARIASTCKSRIRFNDWFFIATRCPSNEPGVVYAWLVHRTADELRAMIAHWPAETIARTMAQPPLCELKAARPRRTIFDDAEAAGAA